MDPSFPHRAMAERKQLIPIHGQFLAVTATMMPRRIQAEQVRCAAAEKAAQHPL
jgi:hypothetical protein